MVPVPVYAQYIFINMEYVALKELHLTLSKNVKWLGLSLINNIYLEL